MAVQRVEQLQKKAIAEDKQLEQQQLRLSLFTANLFERVESLKLNDGTRLDVPSMNEQDRVTAETLFGSVPPEKQTDLQESFDALAQGIRDEAEDNVEGIETGSFSSGLINQLGQSLEVYMLSSGTDQADNAVQGVMFGAMVGIEQELGNFAKDFQNKLHLAGDVRTDITELRDELADWPDDGSKRSFSWTEVTFDENGKMIVTEHTNVALSKEDAQALMEKLEQQLATLTEMNDLQKFDLQRMTHDYQQALSTLSALLKSQHDSLMAIIRNVKS
ncbi:hypothetical protein ACFL6C_08595 [Myxococcota bacterium]